MFHFKSLHLVILLGFSLTACMESFEAETMEEDSSSLEAAQNEYDLPICSALSFDDVTWPSTFEDYEKTALATALNISGSFEGRSGWSNLTNNFDGQGISFGLLNQTLGTGSLQPLLIEFSTKHATLGEQIFGTDNWLNLQSMLDDWASGRNIVISPTRVSEPAEIHKSFVGDAHNGDKLYVQQGLIMPLGASSNSVTWALQNVYVDNGRTFKSDWRTAFKTLGETPEYISIQIKAAQGLHKKTYGWFVKAGFAQFRAYLFLFDIAVQNGSLRTSHFNAYEEYLASNPGKTEQENMLALMEIRVASSLPQWQEDVRRRKSAIINDTGTVHGSFRDLPDEYCYSPAVPLEDI